VFDREVAISFSPESDDPLVFINHYILILLLSVAVCIHGLDTAVNILSSMCKYYQLWANLYRCSTFELNLLFSAE